MFTQREGPSLNARTLSQAFQSMVAGSDLPRIRLHDLRHTHASIAVKAGVPIGVVNERLGHAMPGMQREAADTIARSVRFDGMAA